jgi:replication factor C subunit 2/4
LAKELYGGEYRKRVLELNASDDRGIQAIREKVKTFAQKIVTKLETRSLADFQIIILDEADLLTNDAQSALRRIIEDNSNQTRFCIICNYVSKIIDPIVSRCAKFRFNALSEESQINHLNNIAKQENMKIDSQIINKIQKVSQGDLRKSINLLQTLSKISPSLLNEELIDEICGIIPQHVIIQFLDDCQTKDIKKLKQAVNAFIEEGHSIKTLVNQMGNYIMSEGCKLDEKKKFKLINILRETEKILIQGGTPNIVCLNLSCKVSEIISRN